MFLCIFEDVVVFLLLIFNNKYRSYAWSTIAPPVSAGVHDISVTKEPITFKFGLYVPTNITLHFDEAGC